MIIKQAAELHHMVHASMEQPRGLVTYVYPAHTRAVRGWEQPPHQAATQTRRA